MKNNILLASALLLVSTIPAAGQVKTDTITDNRENNSAYINKKKLDASDKTPRLTLGGYGEAVMSRMFYSDNYKRYTDASLYKDAPSHGRFDLPHVVFWLGYDFGRGWSLGSEVEFEHGGVEAAVEIEEEETGEYESEIERGGEVAIEQFWIQKSFSAALNLRMGHVIVPVGLTNQYHMPTEFFTAFRPEGESTILPCTWHETGISLWGRIKAWRYEAMFITGLDADRFGSQKWIASSSGSPYEFKIANSYAGAFRVDNYSVPGLRMAVSGYVGNSARNSLKSDAYNGLRGTVLIGAFDFAYDNYGLVIRGSMDYGHLDDSERITKANKGSRKGSPSPKTSVASDAMSAGMEAGYDIFSPVKKLNARGSRFYVFGRYDYYDSMFKTQGTVQDNACWERQRVAAGINYVPIKGIVIKAEYSHRMFKSQYNDEDTFSVGIAYSGLFKM